MKVAPSLRTGAAGLLVLGALTLGALASAGPALGATPPADQLLAGQYLRAGGELVAPGGVARLVMQGDGNLVEYSSAGQVLWTAGTSRNPGAFAAMQFDGNFVVYSPAHRALWNSRSGGHSRAAYRLSLQGDSNLVIYTPANKALWADNVRRTPPPAPIAAQHLAGTGQAAVNFSAAGGLAILTAHCGCQGNFIVELDDSSGHPVDYPINVVGNYSGSIAEGLAAGRYIANVTADAPWTITVTQPRNVAASGLPYTYAGTGQQVVGPFAAGSAVKLTATNTSSQGGNFIVQIDNAKGSMQDIPFNQIGSFHGSAVSNGLAGGPYYLAVDSDGSWRVALSRP